MTRPVGDYLEDVARLLEGSGGFFQNAASITTHPDNTGLLRGVLSFAPSGRRLSFFLSAVPLDDYFALLRYRFHFADADGELIFRYDNAPHYPGLPRFPMHKHRRGSVRPQGAMLPSIRNLVREIRDIEGN